MRKKEKAENKFGYIAEYDAYMELKHLVYSQENYKQDLLEKEDNWMRDLLVYAYWCRSLNGCDFKLNHPTYTEYKQYFFRKNVPWLKLRYSYVDVKEYKKWKRKKEKEEKTKQIDIAKTI